MNTEPFEIEELNTWAPYTEQYFLEVLNGDKTIEEAVEDLASFRNSKWYTGTQDKFKTITEES